MPSTIVAITEAVTDYLNGATLSQSFIAERAYAPVHNIKDLTSIAVTVVPISVTGQNLNRRGQNLNEYVIDVAIQKRLGIGRMTNDEVNAVVDPLMQLGEEIQALFGGTNMAGARCIDSKNEPIYASHHIDEQRVFTSVIVLIFRKGSD